MGLGYMYEISKCLHEAAEDYANHCCPNKNNTMYTTKRIVRNIPR